MFVAAMALANLALYIFPYSRPDYNQAVRFAHRMDRVWTDGTVVYYSDFIVDDWYIRYFNPRTTWRQVDLASTSTFAVDADREVNAGHDVWLDNTAADALTHSVPAIAAHFDAMERDDFPKHPIRFYRWRK